MTERQALPTSGAPRQIGTSFSSRPDSIQPNALRFRRSARRRPTLMPSQRGQLPCRNGQTSPFMLKLRLTAGGRYILPRLRHGARLPGTVLATDRISIAFALMVVGALLVFGSILAWRNMKLGRGDRNGAWRLAAFVFSLAMITWVVGASHVAGLWEAYNLTLVLAWSCLSGAFIWMMYMALEPIVRRRLPTLLISWNRLLSGQFNDPMIGQRLVGGSRRGGAFPTSGSS